MKYTTAIKKIEKALNENKRVDIMYHRKWSSLESFGKVFDVVEYEYDGETCKAITTANDLIDSYSFIIDSVDAE